MARAGQCCQVKLSRPHIEVIASPLPGILNCAFHLGFGLDIIVIHQAAGDDAQEPSLVGLAINQLRQLHYPGYLAYDSPHHEVMNGLILQRPDNFRARRRTQNHAMARAARESLIFCK